MKLSRVAAPASLPVTVEEAKLHMRIPASETADDDYVESLLGAATEVVEEVTNRKLITQTWKLFLDVFPSERSFELPYPKLQSVTHVKYYDEEGALQTLSSSLYQVDVNGIVGQIANKNGETWPETEDEKLSAVEVQFVCGYGNASSVPEAIKQAIKVLALTWYENRETVVIGMMAERVPDTARLLLANYRVRSFA